MPGLNPFYWLLMLLLLAIVLLISLAVGLTVYAISIVLAKRKTAATFIFGLPVAAVAATAAFCCSCYGILWLMDHPIPLSPKPTTLDIVGVWTATQNSLDDMKREGGYTISTHTFTFNDDGTFEMVNMPDWGLDSFGESRKGFYSGLGTWEIAEDQGQWVIELHFDHLTSHSNGFNTYLYIEEGKIYYIYTFIGDPDSGQTMAYERIN